MRPVLSLTFLLLLLAVPAVAHAADRPRDLLLDACRDEKVDGTYSQATYRKALAELPADSDQYSACRDVLNRARLAALNNQDRSSAGGGGRSTGGGGGSTGTTGSGGGGGSGGGASGATSGGSPKRAPSADPGGCAGCKGSGTALDTATPDEQRGVRHATESGSRAVRIDGELLRPGAVSSLSSDSDTIPTPLIALLVALGAFTLAAAGRVGITRVIARRTR